MGRREWKGDNGMGGEWKRGWWEGEWKGERRVNERWSARGLPQQESGNKEILKATRFGHVLRHL